MIYSLQIYMWYSQYHMWRELDNIMNIPRVYLFSSVIGWNSY